MKVYVPQWPDEFVATNYPFGDDATLTNGVQFIPEGTMLDAILYVPGTDAGLYLSSVVIGVDNLVLNIGDADNPLLASATLPLLAPPDNIVVVDAAGRQAGLLVSKSLQWGALAAWGAGTYNFTLEQTGFAATCCVPTPDGGVTGVQFDDGVVLAGDVWLVGDDGVVLSAEYREVVRQDGTSEVQPLIRADVVGDPLLRRRLCTPTSLFATPNYLKTLTFQDTYGGNIVTAPDQYGGIVLTASNIDNQDTALRIRPTPSGNEIAMVGSTSED
jgi:hypothetical protein